MNAKPRRPDENGKDEPNVGREDSDADKEEFDGDDEFEPRGPDLLGPPYRIGAVTTPT